jgi:hypothetical protein
MFGSGLLTSLARPEGNSKGYQRHFPHRPGRYPDVHGGDCLAGFPRPISSPRMALYNFLIGRLSFPTSPPASSIWLAPDPASAEGGPAVLSGEGVFDG